LLPNIRFSGLAGVSGFFPGVGNMADSPNDWALAAHELGGALVPVRTSVDLLKGGAAGPLAPEADRLLGIASRSLERVDRVLQNWIAFAAPESHRARPELQDAGEFLAHLRDEFATEAAARRIELRVEAESGGGCFADTQCLDQLLANLVSNALKFTSEGGRVTLRASRARLLPGRLALLGGGFEVQPAFTALEVIDTGIGLSDDARRRCFEPFYRAPEAEDRGIRGSGLGLAVARRLAALLHADLRPLPSPQAGACFRLVLAADPPTWELVCRVDAALAALAARFARRSETLVVLRRPGGFAPERLDTLRAALGARLVEPRLVALELSPSTWVLSAPLPVRSLLVALHRVLERDSDWRSSLRMYAQRVRRGSPPDERLLQGLVRCRHALPEPRAEREASVDVTHPARG
jgi:histidine kinase/DNA gyrase B/HSP90-like ATPase